MATNRKKASKDESTGFISLRTAVILALSAFASIGSVAGGLVEGPTGLLVMIGACVSLHALIDRDR